VGQVKRDPHDIPSVGDVFVLGMICLAIVLVASWLAGC